MPRRCRSWNVFRSYRYGEIVTVDDPWGYGNSLEWVTSCPLPRHNFTKLLGIRSERPAFELHYPHMIARLRAVRTARCRHGHRADQGRIRRMSHQSTPAPIRRAGTVTKRMMLVSGGAHPVLAEAITDRHSNLENPDEVNESLTASPRPGWPAQ